MSPKKCESSQYYYPYNIHLSNTIKAYQQRAANMKGFYCLTWRLTDAIDPKISYIAKAPWDTHNRYSNSESVYKEYARRNYGNDAADVITSIINQNEPFGNDFAECRPTPMLYPNPKTGFVKFNIMAFRPANGQEVEIKLRSRGSSTRMLDTGLRALPGGWLEFQDVDFGQESDSIYFKVSKTEQNPIIEVHHPQRNMRLGSITIPETISADEWIELQMPICPTSGKQTIHLRFYSERIPLEKLDFQKASDQIELVEKQIQQTSVAAYQQRLGWLKARLEGAKYHLLLDNQSGQYQWNDYPGAFEPWAQSFIQRVVDISSLGNIVSVQNRFIRLHYKYKTDALRLGMMNPVVNSIEARGTKTGAIIRWEDDFQVARSYDILRNGKKINKLPIWSSGRWGQFEDTFDGKAIYQVTARGVINNWWQTEEGNRSIPMSCLAGNADRQAPHIVVISPPKSVLHRQPIEIEVRALDNRDDSLITARCFWREAGAPKWQELQMSRRVKAIFWAQIVPPAGAALIEWYAAVSDQDNTAYYPVSAPDNPMTTVILPCDDNKAPARPTALIVENKILRWQSRDKEVWGYLIYRSKLPDFAADPSTLVTYVSGDTRAYQDYPVDFEGQTLNGTYYYKIRAVDKAGNTSPPTGPVSIIW